jgi:hypothetical protein
VWWPGPSAPTTASASTSAGTWTTFADAIAHAVLPVVTRSISDGFLLAAGSSSRRRRLDRSRICSSSEENSGGGRRASARTGRDRRWRCHRDSGQTARRAAGPNRTGRAASAPSTRWRRARCQPRKVARHHVRDCKRQAEKAEQHEAQECQALQDVLRERRTVLTWLGTRSGREYPEDAPRRGPPWQSASHRLPELSHLAAPRN